MPEWPQCSMEHATECVRKIRFSVTDFLPPADQMQAQVLTRAKELLSFSPLAVDRGCERWGREQSTWPSVAKLRAMVEEEHANLVWQDQHKRAVASRDVESWPDKLTRLLGADVFKIGAAHIGLVLALKDEADRMSDRDLEGELRFILEHGYRRRPEPKPVNVARLTQQLMQFRAENAHPALLRIGEAMLERAQEGGA